MNETKIHESQTEAPLYLLATDGDCSARGMGDTNEAILIPPHLRDIVANFLRAQTEYEIEIYLSDVTAGDGFSNFRAATQEMRSHGIFKNKYHCRTSWTLMNGDCLSNHGAFTIV